MWKKQRLSVYTIAAISLIAMILLCPGQCLNFSLNGLNLWFTKMIPALFPFMVLSGIIIRMKITEPCVKILSPVLGRIFRVNDNCIYGIVIGFLCGFPMGAHTAAQLYENKMITKKEAAFLLSFCNNIGPVYFVSFVMPSIGFTSYGLCLFGMYGLPFLYGIFLRYFIYRDISPAHHAQGTQGQAALSLAGALDGALEGALINIARLGGYMVIFNLLFIIPGLISDLFHLSGLHRLIFTGSAGCLLEITGGISLLGKGAPYLVLCILPFGGLSCIAQTAGMIRNTDLSLTEYIMHKMILTAITVFFYFLAVSQSFLP